MVLNSIWENEPYQMIEEILRDSTSLNPRFRPVPCDLSQPYETSRC